MAATFSDNHIYAASRVAPPVPVPFKRPRQWGVLYIKCMGSCFGQPSALFMPPSAYVHCLANKAKRERTAEAVGIFWGIFLQLTTGTGPHTKRLFTPKRTRTHNNTTGTTTTAAITMHNVGDGCRRWIEQTMEHFRPLIPPGSMHITVLNSSRKKGSQCRQ